MFTKVLIVDDIDFNDAAAVQVLNDLNITSIDCSKYCDEALLKIKKAQQENMPFQLLITDLSFKPDHRQEKLQSGQELIDAVKQLFPSIKIIAFSIEDRSLGRIDCFLRAFLFKSDSLSTPSVAHISANLSPSLLMASMIVSAGLSPTLNTTPSSSAK